VNGVGARAPGDLDHPLGHQVGLPRRRRSAGVGLVREANVQSLAVGLGVDRNRRHTELAAGPDDAHRDLAPVGDQHLREHGAFTGAAER
jgi:hypothetical protein